MTADQLPTTSSPEPRDTSSPSTQGGEGKRQCEGTSRKTGERCKAYAVHGERMCAGHLGLGQLDPHRAAQASAQVRRDTAEERKKRPQDVYAEMLNRQAEAYAARLDAIARGNDDAAALRAIELLNARVLGKPTQTVEQVSVERPADLEALKHMSQEERDALYAQLVAADLDL